jgi:hypothetical protein
LHNMGKTWSMCGQIWTWLCVMRSWNIKP